MKTALITGASEGIGREFAILLAQKGFRVILVARNEKRLQSLADELSKYSVEVKIYVKDLSVLENTKYIYEDLKKNAIPVDYLINNAGFGNNGAYADIEWQKELDMFNLNMITLAYFTRVFAGDMKAQGSGRIMNVGSTGSFQPGPYMAGYCATKAFVLSLSEAVNYELKGSGVTVTTLCPGVTDSKFHEVARTEQTLMSKWLAHATSESVARYGLKIMEKGKSSGIHGFLNKIMIFSNRLGPRNVVTAIAAKLMK